MKRAAIGCAVMAALSLVFALATGYVAAVTGSGTWGNVVVVASMQTIAFGLAAVFLGVNNL